MFTSLEFQFSSFDQSISVRHILNVSRVINSTLYPAHEVHNRLKCSFSKRSEKTTLFVLDSRMTRSGSICIDPNRKRVTPSTKTNTANVALGFSSCFEVVGESLPRGSCVTRFCQFSVQKQTRMDEASTQTSPQDSSSAAATTDTAQVGAICAQQHFTNLPPNTKIGAFAEH